MVLTTLATLSLLAPAQSTYDWIQLDGPVRPGIQASWDAARGRLVMLGAEGGTWEYQGNTRLHRTSLGGSSPTPPRTRGVMASDPERGITLLFGGNDTGLAFPPQLGDTWSWDGSSWTQWTGAVSPPARVASVMAYDSERDCFVMYGGQGDSGVLYDTWEHDAAGWRQVLTETTPSVPYGRIAYDKARGVLVLVSSIGITNRPMVVHEYDGTDWTLRPQSGDWPLTRSNMGLAYDESRQVTVMVGGTYYAEEIWEWDGNGWTLAHTLPAPWRIDPVTYYDASLGMVVTVGGVTSYPGSTSITHSDAHIWDGTTFSQIRPDQSPYTRFDEVFFADPVRGTLTMAGGWWSWISNDTWEWDGNAWTQLHPATQLPERRNTSYTFDTHRNIGLVFGGYDSPNYLDDLWAWNGTDWIQHGVAERPAPRQGAGMAFDTARDVAVVFGGSDGPINLCCSERNDTWEWDGTSWSYRASATKPEPRERPAMAYDEGRGLTVLFGGRDNFGLGGQFGDTWEWDGLLWQQAFPLQSPPALADPKLTYDALRGRIVLVGNPATGVLPPMEMWDYDGMTWTQRSVESQSIGGGTNVVWDAARQRIALYDGETLRAWTDSPASAQAYETGCGSNPPATVRTRPRLGEHQFGFEARVAPGQTTLFAIGLQPANTPLGNGCTLLLKPIRWLVTTADSYGSASVVLPLPNNISYRGLSIYGQAGVVDYRPNGTWGLSQGIQAVLGD